MTPALVARLYLYSREGMDYIRVTKRGIIVLSLECGQSRASSAVVNDGPRASFLFHADRRGQGGEKNV